MLYLLDSNVLIYAKMAASPQHKPAKAWLTSTLNDPNSTVLLTETVILSFLRICTNSKAFNPPLSYSDAEDFISALINHNQVNVFRASSDHFIEVADFIKKHGFGGNLVMDAHLAVIALNTGSTLVTSDTDFDKIPYLTTLNPL